MPRYKAHAAEEMLELAGEIGLTRFHAASGAHSWRSQGTRDRIGGALGGRAYRADLPAATDPQTMTWRSETTSIAKCESAAAFSCAAISPGR